MMAAAIAAFCCTELVLASASTNRTLSAAKAFSQASAAVSPAPAMCPRYHTVSVGSITVVSASSLIGVWPASSNCLSPPSSVSSLLLHPMSIAADFWTFSLRPEIAENRCTASITFF
ncbi:hypothetical protein PF005_g2424 [Phytophthora fragariae]|uniref:RxLR effector protein n=1 Tax=Phytophthora fragariae TaxID=53985 RepID=A0A6A3IXP0_9STRA|nr:hypothetical protein PF003_g8516 [Phytophthora fragariae]KAE8928446.1 hypothetical protein PF009_g21413 [Phytophthora fragariae]KAE8987786.1 hypothetical protein PF011_g19434 [Phytophthora fragariae]KAE9135594.1 hypothetical protein PF010_g2005 [Phytophthora fragariae]KAE9135925.1 hypothetical protein PF007_g2370 [Phytophthora fragariae]